MLISPAWGCSERLLLSTATRAAELSSTGSSKNQHFSNQQLLPLIPRPLAGGGLQPTFLLLLQHEHPGSGLSASEEPDQILAILLAARMSSACARLLPLVSLAEFCAGCCLTKTPDTAHWHHHLGTEPQATQKTPVTLALQVMAVWLK